MKQDIAKALMASGPVQITTTLPSVPDQSGDDLLREIARLLASIDARQQRWDEEGMPGVRAS